jgi:hypothetical protein
MGSSGRFEALIGMGVVVWLAAVAVAAPPLEAVEGLFDASRPHTGCSSRRRCFTGRPRRPFASATTQTW